MKFNGHNVRISSKAVIGSNVKIGDDTVIYDNVEIGDNAIISDNCIIGEPTSGYYVDEDYKNPTTTIGRDSLVRSHAIIYAGVQIGSHLQTGHRITVREESVIGDHCSIGTLCDLQGHLTMGNYCRLHSNVHLCQQSKLGDYVFLYPNVVLANDKHPPSEHVLGPNIGDYVQVGVQSTIVGDVKIGDNSLIGANSLITNSFEGYSFIIGSPARRKSDVRELRAEDGSLLYPWKGRFSRGMPWEENRC